MGFWEDLFRPFGEKAKPKKPAYNNYRENFNKTQGYTSNIRALSERRAASRVDRNREAGRAVGYRPDRSALTKPKSKFVPSPNRVDRITQPNTYMGNPQAQAPMIDPRDALIEDIMGQLDDQFQAPAQQSGDYGRAAIMSALDEALNGALGGINSARTQTQGNFRESDANLVSMHSALVNDTRTRGKQEFNDIADELVGNIQGNTQGSVQQLNQLEAQDTADRIAMLKNLGIQASGRTSGTTAFDDAAADITERGATANQLAQQDRTNNLEYNEGMAQTANMQGAMRRAALNQQLQSILGQLAGKESDVRSRYSEQKAAAEAEIENRRMQDTAQQNALAYEQWQNQQNNLRETLGMTLEDQNRDEQSAQEQARWEAEMGLDRERMLLENQQAPKPPDLSGLGQMSQDLLNQGMPPQMVRTGMAALAQGASEGHFERDNSVQKKIAYLAGKGIPPDVAFQIVTHYSNL